MRGIGAGYLFLKVFELGVFLGAVVFDFFLGFATGIFHALGAVYGVVVLVLGSWSIAERGGCVLGEEYVHSRAGRWSVAWFGIAKGKCWGGGYLFGLSSVLLARPEESWVSDGKSRGMGSAYVEERLDAFGVLGRLWCC